MTQDKTALDAAIAKVQEFADGMDEEGLDREGLHFDLNRVLEAAKAHRDDEVDLTLAYMKGVEDGKAVGNDRTLPTEAIKNLREHQVQMDFDGIQVGVSRQALDEVLDYIAKIEQTGGGK